jgi:hypothetical protein
MAPQRVVADAVTEGGCHPPTGVDAQLPTQFGERQLFAKDPSDLLSLELGAEKPPSV